MGLRTVEDSRTEEVENDSNNSNSNKNDKRINTIINNNKVEGHPGEYRRASRTRKNNDSTVGKSSFKRPGRGRQAQPQGKR